MLAQIPANACSDSESRKCSLVLLLVSYMTLAKASTRSIVENDAIRATRKPRPKQDYLNHRQEPSPRALHSTMTNKLDYSNQIFHSLGSMSDSDERHEPRKLSEMVARGAACASVINSCVSAEG
mgnify:CR=1 FL=1